MGRHPVIQEIKRADRAINQEDFDTVMDIYADDALLVVRPGLNAVGKVKIRKAFEAIAGHFDHSLKVRQDDMAVLEAGDLALVLARAEIAADGVPPLERKAVYVFRRGEDGRWLCVIDNSYGHELLP